MLPLEVFSELRFHISKLFGAMLLVFGMSSNSTWTKFESGPFCFVGAKLYWEFPQAG